MITTMAKLHFGCAGYAGAWFVSDTLQLSWLPPDSSSPTVMEQPGLCTTSSTGLILSTVTVFLWHSIRILLHPYT